MEGNGKFVRTDDHWIARNNHISLIRFEIDNQLTLLFADITSGSDPSPFRLTIEGKCLVRVGDQTEQVDPQDTATLTPVFDLLSCQVEAFKIYDNGDLVVSFSDNKQLHIPADVQYEAWQFRYEKDFVVSKPGGNLAIWGLLPED